MLDMNIKKVQHARGQSGEKNAGRRPSGVCNLSKQLKLKKDQIFHHVITGVQNEPRERAVEISRGAKIAFAHLVAATKHTELVLLLGSIPRALFCSPLAVFII
jgi:hypothetical protein